MKSLVMVILGIGLVMPAFAQQQNAEPVRQAIQDYVALWQKRFNEHDSKDLVTMYTSDAVRVFPNGRILSGLQNIEKNFVKGAEVFSNVSIKLEDVKTQGDVAWGYAHWTIMRKDDKGIPQQASGDSTITWVREAGSWKIAQEGVVSQILPPPK
jgi:uncharacterized protein (TIGR02246 family)